MIAILQPYIPHYREQFFNRLRQRAPFDLYCYEEAERAREWNFLPGQTRVKYVGNIKAGPFILFNPLPFLKKEYTVLVLMLNVAHISTWLILLLKPFIRQKVILWGHGISVKRYVREERKPHILLKWMIALSDGIWFYTGKELALWQRIVPGINGHALNNTISDVESILGMDAPDKRALKARYGIRQSKVIIYCARFNEPGRRVDLLLELIEKLHPERFAFIIIGEGRLKPDFSSFRHVYDFGAVYDRKVKDELFCIADIYFQPGWVGLSVVEAMSYGKPVFTLRRSEGLLQCVEYSYIQHQYNGLIFDSMESCIGELCAITEAEIRRMGGNARDFVKKELTMDRMVDNAFRSIRSVSGKLAEV
jgi:glycosyltransferase involved in cell wall biosynthesis